MTKLSRRRLLGTAAVGAAWTFGIGRARADDPIKFGAALSLTGRFSDSAKYVQEGYALWSEKINAAGGIKGRQVQIITYDDESNPDTGRVLAERLIDRDGVLAILGPYSSPITDSMATACERAQVPMIGTIASDSSIWSRRKIKWSLQGFTSSDFDHEGFLKIVAAKRGTAKRLAVVFEEAPFSIAAKEWAVPVAKQMGLEVETYGYSPGSQDFRSIIERMVAAGTELVSMGGYYQPSVALTRQMMERGFNPVAYHFIQASDGVTKDALGANAEGIFGRSAWEASIDTPANKEFVAAYKAKYNRIPSYHSASAFAAGECFAQAIAAKGADRAGILAHLSGSGIETVMGKFQVNDKGQQVGYRYVSTQWQGKDSVVVGGVPEASAHASIWPKPKWS